MLFERKRGFVGLYGMIILVVLSLTFVGWFTVNSLYRGEVGFAKIWDYATYLMILDGLLLLHTALNGERCWEGLSGTVTDRILLALRQTAVLFIGLFLFLVASKDKTISRVFLFSLIPVTAIALAWVNIFISRWMMPLLFSEGSLEQCVLVDWGDHHHLDAQAHSPAIGRMAQWLARQGQYGIHLKGVLSHSEVIARDLGVSLLGEPESVADLLQGGGVTMLLLLQMPPQKNQMTHLIHLCERHGVRILVVHDLAEHFGRPIELTTHDGVHLLHFRSEPLQNPVNRLLKRLLDIAVSLPVVLFILPPLALVVWILQRIHSPGPLFFTHGRNGRNNAIFQLFKFRTMHVANDDINRQASRNDSRIYRGGDLLRRTSLDEIPQFLNVLRGEMSVVGPRPHLPQHNRLWQEIAAPYNVRTFVRPGITGLAQTRGYRGEAVTEDDIRNRVECDIEYIESWTLLLDLGLIFKTARQVIFPEKTAY